LRASGARKPGKVEAVHLVNQQLLTARVGLGHRRQLIKRNLSLTIKSYVMEFLLISIRGFVPDEVGVSFSIDL
jgi:hypothetical protein